MLFLLVFHQLIKNIAWDNMSPTPSLPSPPTWVRRGVILDLFSHLEEKWWFGMKTCTDSYLHQRGGPSFHVQGLAPLLISYQGAPHLLGQKQLTAASQSLSKLAKFPMI